MANDDEVKITKLPSPAPTNIRITKKDTEVKLEWGKPSQAEWNTDCRWEYTDAWFIFGTLNSEMQTDWAHSHDGARYVTHDRIWVHDLGIVTSATAEIDREQWYPVKKRRRLHYVHAAVVIMNRIGNLEYHSIKDFELPDPPEFEEPEMDLTTQEVSVVCKVKRDDTSVKECYDCVYWATVQDNFFVDEITGNKGVPKKVLDEQYSKEEEFTITTDSLNAITTLLPGQWAKVTFHAYTRGFVGDSETVTKSYVVAFPDAPTITNVVAYDPNAMSGVIAIFVDPGHIENWRVSDSELLPDDHIPVEKIKLQRLRNTTAQNAEAASQIFDGWEDVSNAEDNWNTHGFVDTVADAAPDRGKYTYYRAVSTNGMYTRYGMPYKADALTREAHPVSDDAVAIHSIISGNDGTSLKLVLAWNDDDSVGTEVSWSENEDAWYSTEQPNTYDVTWEDDELPDGMTGYTHAATLVIRGLTEGTKYYVKARRYSDAEDSKVYSTVSVTPTGGDYPMAPYTAPSNVKLAAPPYVKLGSDLDFTWTFDSESAQKQWSLNLVADDGEDRRVTCVANGDDSTGMFTLGSDVVNSFVYDNGGELTNPVLTFYVSVTTGGAWVDSDDVVVAFQEPPEVELSVSETLSSQPLQFGVKSSEQLVDLVIKVLSRGVSTVEPDGEVAQLYGDVVWSDRISPVWNELPNGDFTTVVTLPFDRPFYNGCQYDVRVAVISRETGLSSDVVQETFVVDWSHVAHRCADTSAVTVDPVNRRAVIHPEKPDNWLSTDRFDVYRVTAESVSLLVGDLQYGATVTDRYAPYSKVVPLAYRIVTKTVDNDKEWGDLEYRMHVPTMRFDWGEDEFVELPYDVEISDAYTKDFESRTHIDGTTIGYWNPGVTHKGSLKTKLLRLLDAEQITKVHSLSKYSGPVFVRLPNGLAYTANVSVSSIDDNYTQLVKNVSINADEIEAVDQFRAAAQDVAYGDDYVPRDRTEPYSRKQLLVWTTSRDFLEAVYELNETPTSDVVVEMTVSSDGYVQRTILDSVWTEGAKIVTVIAQDEPINEYIASQPEGTQFILRALYNV